MKTISVSEFKAHALELIDRTFKTKDPLIITKRGKPVAQLIAYRESASKPQPGKLSAYLVFEEDIVSPLESDLWEANR